MSFSLWLMANRLRALERLLLGCIGRINIEGNLTPFLDAELHLAIKAVSSLNATINLIQKEHRQESQGTHRTFLETWVFMMHFAWFPHDPLFTDWEQNPEKFFSEPKYRFKQKVEAEIPNRLGLAVGRTVPLRDLFASLSNRAVHPTKHSAVSAWADAAQRQGFQFSDFARKEWGNVRITDLMLSVCNLFLQIHLFLRFLRMEVLSLPEIPKRFCQQRMSFLESFLETWVNAFAPRFKLAIQSLQEQTSEE